MAMAVKTSSVLGSRLRTAAKAAEAATNTRGFNAVRQQRKIAIRKAHLKDVIAAFDHPFILQAATHGLMNSTGCEFRS
jgi:hypothetical protein